MEEYSFNILRKCKTFNNIIKKLDVLNSFYVTTYELLETENDFAKKKYKDEFLVLDKLDKLTADYKNIDETKIKEFENISLSNKKHVSDYIKLSVTDGSNSEKGGPYLKMEKSNSFDLFGARKIKEDCESKFDILNTSILDRMVSIFEEYLASIYTILIIENPEKYIGGKQVSLVELLNKKGNLIFQAIESEVDSQMFDSMKCLNDILKKNDISLDLIAKEMKNFNEIYYRRNLFVHNGGIVNNLYLAAVTDSPFKIGDKLVCDKDYNKKAFNNMAIFLSSLEFYFEKFIKSYEKRARSLSEYGFDCLKKGKYEIAEHVYGLLKTKKDIEHVDKLMYFINYLNAKKQLKINIFKELSTLDVSACSDNFKLAKLCLENKNEDVLILLDKTYPHSVSAEELREWPLFIDFRKTKFYKEFVNKHKSDFKTFKIEDDNKKKDEFDSDIDNTCDLSSKIN